MRITMAPSKEHELQIRAQKFFSRADVEIYLIRLRLQMEVIWPKPPKEKQK